MFIFSTIQATLLLAVALLGIAARLQRELADKQAEHGRSVFITDEVDVVAADAELATAAALRALDEADQAQDRALWASTTRDIAEQRHRQALKDAEAASQTHRLVQRAALDAYQMTAESTPSPAAVPLGWELRVREARRRYEQAAADAARAEDEAQRAAATAAALADHARAAESLLSAARRSANVGLVGLLRAAWADPVAR
jgi:hypothetical protein